MQHLSAYKAFNVDGTWTETSCKFPMYRYMGQKF